ncbi:MAG: oxidoreductase, partial [Alphaproteobacteria bacterium]|nr:oxidoreductase [Alphaproteobacteria bacterium]
FDNLLESYAREVEKIGNIRVAVLDPGATRTAMRAKAYPGEDPKTVKQPGVVASRIVELVVNGYDTPHRERVAEPD